MEVETEKKGYVVLLKMSTCSRPMKVIHNKYIEETSFPLSPVVFLRNYDHVELRRFEMDQTKASFEANDMLRFRK